MKVSVQVKVNSKIESIEKKSEGVLVVRVGTPPVDGKANVRVIEMLAEYFKTPKSKIKLLKGEKSKKKVFDIG